MKQIKEQTVKEKLINQIKKIKHPIKNINSSTIVYKNK